MEWWIEGITYYLPGLKTSRF